MVTLLHHTTVPITALCEACLLYYYYYYYWNYLMRMNVQSFKVSTFQVAAWRSRPSGFPACSGLCRWWDPPLRSRRTSSRPGWGGCASAHGTASPVAPSGVWPPRPTVYYRIYLPAGSPAQRITTRWIRNLVWEDDSRLTHMNKKKKTSIRQKDTIIK